MNLDIKVIIEGIETNSIRVEKEEQAQFLISQFLTGGYPHKISDTEIHFYPASHISRIELVKSMIALPRE